MTIRQLVLPAVLMLAAPLVAAEPTPLETMVAAERAFSALSVDQGMKTAFITYLADDAILFRPGPVNGQQVWRTRPEAKSTLIWEPSFGEVSGSGEMGFDTGPWELRPPAGSDQTKAYGHFVSVWKRDGDGPWRVAVDIGVSHTKPEQTVGEVEFRAGPTHPAPKPERGAGGGLSVGGAVYSGGLGVGVGTGSPLSARDREWRRTKHEINALMGTERTFGFRFRTKGAERAFRDVAAEDLRFYREGALPSLGIEAAVAGTGTRERNLWWDTRGSGVSKSWDLGYTYGLVGTKPVKGARADTSSFAHVWRKDPTGRWKMVLDIENPFPKPE